jgi:hypothetical protein
MNMPAKIPNLPKPIRLKKLLKILQTAYDKHADKPSCQRAIDVEFWTGDEELALAYIGQFGVKPDVAFRFHRPNNMTSNISGHAAQAIIKIDNRLRKLLLSALAEHDDHNGVGSDPRHWSDKARKALKP